MTAIEPPSSNTIRSAASAMFRRLPGALSPVLGAAVCFRLLAAGLCAAQSPTPIPKPQWTLTWNDEFDGASGSGPDPAKWSYELGGSGFGNNELETYTARRVNAQQLNGRLALTARKEDFTGADGKLRHYTSGRLRTQGLFSQTYGRFEARMKLPTGRGLWPAFWLLGSDIDAVGWPESGEIDIVENIGEPAVTHSTIHGPGYSGAHGPTIPFRLPPGERVDTGFHLYAVEWAPNDLKFFFDRQLVVERTPADLPIGAKWVFDKPFFILLNLAVGGDWPGNPDAKTSFPQQLLVDYVRVYKAASTSGVAGR